MPLPGLKPEQLAGTWTATKAEYVGKTSGSRVDLVAAIASFAAEPVSRERFAVDLGCGAGRDARELRGARV